MTSRINNLWRACKHIELAASVNTSVISRINYLYATKQPTSNVNEIVKVFYPVYNTHVLDSEWEDICKMIYNSVKTLPGIEVKSVKASEGQPSYRCIVLEINVSDDYWTDTPDERV